MESITYSAGERKVTERESIGKCYVTFKFGGFSKTMPMLADGVIFITENVIEIRVREKHYCTSIENVIIEYV